MKKNNLLYNIIKIIYDFNAKRNILLVFLNYFCDNDILFQLITLIDKGCPNGHYQDVKKCRLIKDC